MKQFAALVMVLGFSAYLAGCESKPAVKPAAPPTAPGPAAHSGPPMHEAAKPAEGETKEMPEDEKKEEAAPADEKKEEAAAEEKKEEADKKPEEEKKEE